MAKMWKLEDGLTLVRSIQKLSRKYGYHVALGGSVLNSGESEKDIDLYFLPMGSDSGIKEEPGELVKWLSSLWGEPELIGKDYAGPDPDGQLEKQVQDYYYKINEQHAAYVNEPVVVDNRLPAAYQRGPEGQRVVAVPDPYKFVVNWDITKDYMGSITSSSTTISKGSAKSAYKYRLKFIRPSDEDRIDVFVL